MILANRATDYAGGIGLVFRGLFAFSCVSAIGALVAVAAFLRQEKPSWISIAAMLVNALLSLPAVWIAVNRDGD